MMDDAAREENLRVWKHETETPMHGHDEDAACCQHVKQMPEFTAAEWVVIKGRGDLAAIAKCHPDPRSLAGQLVKIDGDEYRVLGVETPATLEWSGDFGLFIGERKQ
jgi:hypothetical protein